MKRTVAALSDSVMALAAIPAVSAGPSSGVASHGAVTAAPRHSGDIVVA
jgi:hypothetical protein